MVPTGRRHELEELLAGSRWARGLARGLVGDASSADDVAQDAWVAALSRPDAVRDPRAWLGGVVRRLARRAARSGERRRRREHLAARGELVPSTDELVERSELQERLSAAVRALDEPYRSTVLLHYAEGIALEEIARGLGMPASTVRTRLSRALERLRARLDREHGGRATWLAALAPLASAPSVPFLPTTSLALGSLTMGAKTGLGVAGIAAGVAVLAVTVALRVQDRGAAIPPPSEGPAKPGATAELGASAGQGIAEPRADERLAIRGEGSADSGGVPLLLYGALQSSQGEPVPQAYISLWNEQGEQRTATIARTSWSIVGLTAGAWSLTATAHGYYPLREVVTLQGSAHEARLDLVLERARALRIRFVDAEGRAVIGADTRAHPLLPGLGAVATREPPGRRIAGVETGSPGGGDAGQYVPARPLAPVDDLPPDCAGLLVLTQPAPVYVSAVLRDIVLETRPYDGNAEELVFVVDEESLKSNLSALTLRVVDARTGAPLEGRVTPSFSNGGVPGARTDAQGVVAFDQLVPGLRWLEVDARDHQRARRIIRLEPGQTLDLGTVALAPERTLRGRLLDEEGRPLAARFSFVSSDQVWCPLDLESRVGWSGGEDFQLSGLGDGEPWLLLQGEEYAVNPLRIETDAQGGVSAIARRGTPVILKHGERARPGRSYAIADASGRPFWLRGVHSEVPIRLRLVPGSYQLLEGRDEVFALARVFEVGDETVVLEP